MVNREFLLFSNEGRTKGDFNPKNLMRAGRLDIVVNSLIQSLFVSEKIRLDVRIHLILNGPPDPPKYIYINPKPETPFSKKDLGTLIKIALSKYRPNKRVEALPGIFIEKKYYEDVLDSLEGKHIFLLDRKGIFIDEINFKEFLDRDMVFILGDHLGLPKYAKRYAIKKNAIRLSLGNVTYYTSQCIAIINFYLDKSFEKVKLMDFKSKEIEEV